MTWSQALITLGITIVLANIVGIILRSIQEKFTLTISLLTVIVYIPFVLVFILIPIFLIFKALFDKELPSYKRLLYAILAVPIGYIYQIGRFPELLESMLLKPLREINSESETITKVTVTIKGITIPIYSRSIFALTSKGIFDAIETKLKIT